MKAGVAKTGIFGNTLPISGTDSRIEGTGSKTFQFDRNVAIISGPTGIASAIGYYLRYVNTSSMISTVIIAGDLNIAVTSGPSRITFTGVLGDTVAIP